VDIFWIIIVSIVAHIPIYMISWKKKALRNPDGMIMAGLIGFTIFYTDIIIWIALMLFFASSTLLTKFKGDSKEKVIAFNYAEKGGERDYLQVFANGGPAFLGAVILLIQNGIWNSSSIDAILIFSFVAIGASCADTWSTEIGTTATQEPVWILNLSKQVPRGTSGGVTVKGTAASFLGSLMIGSLYLLSSLLISGYSNLIIIGSLVIIFAGFSGSVIDSLLGATGQAVFQCPSCKKLTEKKKHPRCNYVETKLVSGKKWLNNDVVNLLSSLLAGLIGLFFYLIITTNS
jgi:uncharacterized protein (TIGR00297 family)